MVSLTPPPVPPRLGLTLEIVGVRDVSYVYAFELVSLKTSTSTITSHCTVPEPVDKITIIISLN